MCSPRLHSGAPSPRWNRMSLPLSKRALDMSRKLVSIVVPCYNEEGNVEEVARRVRETMAQFTHLDYEHIFIDNASKDTTLAILRRLASEDQRIKVIVNARNFGHLRSPMYGMLQAAGDAVVLRSEEHTSELQSLRHLVC